MKEVCVSTILLLSELHRVLHFPCCICLLPSVFCLSLKINFPEVDFLCLRVTILLKRFGPTERLRFCFHESNGSVCSVAFEQDGNSCFIAVRLDENMRD